MKYRAGKENAYADVFSRFPITSAPPEETSPNVAGVATLAVTAAGPEENIPDADDQWAAAQTADLDIQLIRRYVEQGLVPSGQERKCCQLV